MAELIECQDSLINLMIKDNQDYFLDVLSETDAYYDYLESKQKLNKYGNIDIHRANSSQLCRLLYSITICSL